MEILRPHEHQQMRVQRNSCKQGIYLYLRWLRWPATTRCYRKVPHQRRLLGAPKRKTQIPTFQLRLLLPSKEQSHCVRGRLLWIQSICWADWCSNLTMGISADYVGRKRPPKQSLLQWRLCLRHGWPQFQSWEAELQWEKMERYSLLSSKWQFGLVGQLLAVYSKVVFK